MDLMELVKSNPLAQFGTLKPGQLPSPGPPTPWDESRQMYDAPGQFVTGVMDSLKAQGDAGRLVAQQKFPMPGVDRLENLLSDSLPNPLSAALMSMGAPKGMGALKNAMPPGKGAPSAAQSMPIPESTVQAHLGQMKPLPNQGIKPTPEVMATEGMGGDAAEAAINAAMGIKPSLRTGWEPSVPFRGQKAYDAKYGKGPGLMDIFNSPRELVQNQSPLQQSMMGRANERIDRINGSNLRWGMPPIPYEGGPQIPGASLGPFTQQPGLMKAMFKAGQKPSPSIQDLLGGMNP